MTPKRSRREYEPHPTRGQSGPSELKASEEEREAYFQALSEERTNFAWYWPRRHVAMENPQVRKRSKTGNDDWKTLVRRAIWILVGLGLFFGFFWWVTHV